MATATKYTRMAGVAEHLWMAGATGYVDEAGNSMPVRMVTVAGYAARDGQSGTVTQHVSEGHYEPTVCSSVNAGFDMVGVANGARGVTRQTSPTLGHTGPVWVDVRSVGLYSIAGYEQD